MICKHEKIAENNQDKTCRLLLTALLQGNADMKFRKPNQLSLILVKDKNVYQSEYCFVAIVVFLGCREEFDENICFQKDGYPRTPVLLVFTFNHLDDTADPLSDHIEHFFS